MPRKANTNRVRNTLVWILLAWSIWPNLPANPRQPKTNGHFKIVHAWFWKIPVPKVRHLSRCPVSDQDIGGPNPTYKKLSTKTHVSDRGLTDEDVPPEETSWLSWLGWSAEEAEVSLANRTCESWVSQLSGRSEIQLHQWAAAKVTNRWTNFRYPQTRWSRGCNKLHSVNNCDLPRNGT